MCRTYCAIFFIYIFIPVYSNNLNIKKSQPLDNVYLNFLNNDPNKLFNYEESVLQSTHQIDDDCFEVEVLLKVSDLNNQDAVKYLKCKGTLIYSKDKTLSTLNDHQCQDITLEEYVSKFTESVTTTETAFIPIHLDNEVQTNTAVTSGEQFVAVPRVQPSVPCVGCASQVNPQAPGVIELANLGVKQLDRHEPNTRHTLTSVYEVERQVQVTSGEQFVAVPRVQPSVPCVGCASQVNPQAPGVIELANLGVKQLDRHEPNTRHTLTSVYEVERQVQVVNGVRYILTVSVEFNNCSYSGLDVCTESKICKISILEKPWVKLPDGSKYRAIVANNCTENWLFDDNGEVITDTIDNNNENNNINSSLSKIDIDTNNDVGKVIHNIDVQSQPNNGKVFTDEDLKMLQKQIIPNNQLYEVITETVNFASRTDSDDTHAERSVNNEVQKKNKDHLTQLKQPEEKLETNGFTEDKKKAIDDLINFFELSGFDPKYTNRDDNAREKRSYERDLEVMSLAEKFLVLKNNIDNAKKLYRFGQIMVDYLNEMDLELKTCILKDVVAAEEEYDNHKKYIYLQIRVIIPCYMSYCKDNDIKSKICNGILESIDDINVRVLNSFCYNEEMETSKKTNVNHIAVDDPLLLKLANKVTKKIEFESSYPNAIKIQKIIDSNTQRVESIGTVTRIYLIVVYTNCSKTTPLSARINCVVLESLGSNICEAVVHKKHFQNDGNIMYSCMQRSIDESFSMVQKGNEYTGIDDPKIVAMIQDALQYLEAQSTRNNKLRVLKVKSISTQIVSGILTKIEFVVAYTTCIDNVDVDINTCKILDTENFRQCNAEIWDRPWLEESRQLKVDCINSNNEMNEIHNFIRKRAIKDKLTDKDYNNVQYYLLAKKQKQGTKRRVPGGSTEQDPNAPKYKKLAEQSLQKYLQMSGSDGPHKVIKVEKVTTQVVSGTLTRIDFKVEGPGDVLSCHSKVWEQPWLNKKEIYVNCNIDNQKYRTKREVRGGSKEQDPNAPEYKELAEQSLQKYLRMSGSDGPHKVIKVEKVTKQVVSGTLTRIDFKVEGPGDVLSCHSKVWEQPWLNKKEIDVNCNIDNQKYRTKREVRGGSKEQEERTKGQVVGGLREQDPNAPEYKELAEQSLQKYLQTSGSDGPHKVIKVVKVTTQVVSGTLTRIDFKVEGPGDVLSCHSKVWEQPWLNKKDIDVNCNIDNQEDRTKREAPGGSTEQDPNAPKYKKLAEQSLQKYLQMSGSDGPHKVIKVEKVTKQVVSGTLTRIDFKVEGPGNVLSCHSKVWEQPWLNKKDINVNCNIDNQEDRTNIEVPGGSTEQDPNAPKYKELAEQSLQKYLQMSGSDGPHKVIKVEKVTTQVVSGTLTRIDFKVEGPGDVLSCHSKVWEQPWLNKKEIDVNCNIDNQEDRTKREVPGESTEQDPNAPEYKELAEQSLQKYLQMSGSDGPHKVIKVEKVTTQVVSGTLTRIDFKVEGPGDVLSCHSKVWEQPWLNKKEIDVNCNIDNQKYRTKREVRGGSKEQEERTKGQVVGGLREQDPNAPEYKELAEQSLQKYLQTSGSDGPHKVIKVVKVTTQVVSGTLTRIDFKVEGPGDVLSCHSKVWEQPWLNKKDIDVNCNIDNQEDRTKREALGGSTEQDPNAPKYKKLAEQSLQKYLQMSGSDGPHKVIKVEKVTTQVVSGTLTRIDFKVEGPGDVLSCHSKVWEQPWLNKKEIDVNCNIDNQEDRTKREVPGESTEQDPNAPEYKELAEQSLQKYLQMSGSDGPHKVIKVEKVTTQVVSGTLTRIDFKVEGPGDVLSCHSKVWEQPWLNKKEIDVNCNIDNQKYRTKREVRGGSKEQEERTKGQVVGGLREQDPNAPEYKELAEQSLQKYLQTSGSDGPHKVIKVEKVTTQVVSGTLTRIDFKVEGPGDVLSCHSKVWEQPWLNKKEIDVNCNIDDQEERTKGQVVGGLREQYPNAPEYKELAEQSLQKYLQTSGSDGPHKVIKVEKVTKQVVSGTLTRIDFKVEGPGDVLSCHSKVWEQPWLNKKEIDVNCNIDNQKYRTKREVRGGSKEQEERTKGQVVGGLREQDPNAPEYKELAEQSLQKYLQTSGSDGPHKVIKVEKVTKQVVSGTLTRIDFKVEGPGDVLSCHSKVWEQPWLNKKEIDVNCNIDNQKYRTKREVRGGSKEQEERTKGQVVGGLREQDPNAPEYKELAEQSLQKYLQTSGSDGPHKVIKVEKVTKQVVSGTLTRIDFKVEGPGDVLSCHSKVWEQPWLNKKEIDVNCNIDNQKYRTKREVRGGSKEQEERTKGQVVGGLREQDPNAPEYKELAEQSLQKYLQTSGSDGPHKVIKVEKVTKQVVSGTLTRIDFKVEGPGDVLSCHSKVWEQPWLNKKEIDVNCNIDNQKYRTKREVRGGSKEQEERTKGQVVGGLREQDPNAPEYKELAEQSLQKYLQTSGSDGPHKVIKVVKVTTQVVSGTLTRIDFKVEGPGDVLSCHSKVWEQPWLNKKDINVLCSIENPTNRRKRSLGALVEKDKSKSEYKSMAYVATQKYQKNIKSSYAFKVLKVLNVQEKIIEGSLTRLKYLISPTNCLLNDSDISVDDCELQIPIVSFYCTANVWDRPWIKKDIKVKCTGKNVKGRSAILNKTTETQYFRKKRQLLPEEDDVDEDSSYYYAERAVQYLNEKADTQNLQKLITIHAAQNSIQMGTLMIRMYIETAYTYCLRHGQDDDLPYCDEIEGLNHKLCFVRLWPSPDDELVIKQISVVCDDEQEFATITGISFSTLIKKSLEKLEQDPSIKYKQIHQGETSLIPSLDTNVPFKLSFLAASTNCSKSTDVYDIRNRFKCYVNPTILARMCESFIWMVPNTRNIKNIRVVCNEPGRTKRSISVDPFNLTAEDIKVKKLVQESLKKLESQSLHRYKQRVLQINNYITTITTGKLTTIDFDIGYTSCLKYEYVENITSCEFLEHLPRRHCVSRIFERLWIKNGKNIDVTCEDDETPLEAHIEFESANTAMHLANQALKHIEAKYPHPFKQKVVRIFSLEKQDIAGIHYRMKIEVGYTNCLALSIEEKDCKIVNNQGLNKFCRVNIWLRPWVNHPPNYRITCDYQQGGTAEIYHLLQAETLFHNFLATYRPDYLNDHTVMQKKFAVFRENIRKIHELNMYELGTARYAVTRFADLTYVEFSSKYLGLQPKLKNENEIPFPEAEIPTVELPEKFDWRDYDAVTEVKDQGSCGSCWAFSVTGNIEGQWKMQSGQLVSLSEQELVDCDKLDQGCNGGLPDNAYRAIEQLGGLETENDYPYEGDDEKCSFNKTLSKVQISGAVNISSNETQMAQWLVHNGPISIGINANAMQFYVGGVSHPWKMLCDPTNLDHGVLIVGFGEKDYPLFHKKLPYWIVKNSWGKFWGEQGYYRVYRGDGTCGVNQMASSAVI